MADTNRDGELAEMVVNLRLRLEHISNRVAPLGPKWPVLDTLVEFENNSRTYYFFAQVKSTRLGPRGAGVNCRLEIDLDKDHHHKLANHFGPTYLIGVDLSAGALSDDVPTPKAYVCVIRGKVERGVYSIPISPQHELTRFNVERLYQEVVNYWNAMADGKHTYTSNFERP